MGITTGTGWGTIGKDRNFWIWQFFVRESSLEQVGIPEESMKPWETINLVTFGLGITTGKGWEIQTFMMLSQQVVESAVPAFFPSAFIQIRKHAKIKKLTAQQLRLNVLRTFATLTNAYSRSLPA